ncbi:MAG: ycdJ [Polyangiaceae bacterium]|jgi:pimeloyl-ACP methyl ester carboxylesterase|nr:ycdJ [Polyangiaceae bacterium]
MLSLRKVAGPQGELAVTEAGNGDALPLLFLHADSGRAGQWREVQTELAPERRTAALDFRGSGESAPARDGDYTYAGRAGDVTAVLDALGWERCVLVAHSGGGAVALEFAARAQSRVAGLLLVDPPADPRGLPAKVRDGFVRDLAGPQSLQVQQDYYRSIAGDKAETRARVLADCEAVSAEARAGIGQALATWDPEPALQARSGSALILVTPPNDTEHALHRLRPDIPHRIVGGAGHWLQIDQPMVVAQAIRSFVSGFEPA